LVSPEKTRFLPTRPLPFARPRGKRDDRDSSSSRALSMAVHATTMQRAAWNALAPDAVR
jgi:hypothetical protein